MRARPLLVLLPLVALGCGRIDRARQCEKLADKLNPALGDIRTLAAGAQDDPTALRTIATRYSDLSKQLGQAPPRDAELLAGVAELTACFDETTLAVRALADALSPRGSTAHAIEQRRRLEALTARERTAAVRLESLCRGH